MPSEILSQNYQDKVREGHIAKLKNETEGFYIITGLKDRILKMLEESYDLGYKQGSEDYY
jgi:hypothetical protein